VSSLKCSVTQEQPDTSDRDAVASHWHVAYVCDRIWRCFATILWTFLGHV
jgi:hypothetical protein